MLFRMVDLLFVGIIKDRPVIRTSRWLGIPQQTRPFDSPSALARLSSRRPLVLCAMTNGGDVNSGMSDIDYWKDLLSLAPLQEIQSFLALIVEENVEAVRYATISVEDGLEVARKNRKCLFDSTPNVTENMITCYNKLNLLLTNMAIDNVRAKYLLEDKFQAREFLDAFVTTIDSSQTVTRLLAQSPIQRTSNAAAARYKRSADTGAESVSSVDTPRYLVEQLMFEGLKAHRESSIQGFGSPKTRGDKVGGPGSVGKAGGNAGGNSGSAAEERSKMMAERKSKYADSFAKRISDELEAEKSKGVVDVLAIAQDVLDERAALSQLIGAKVAELVKMNLKTTVDTAAYLGRVTLPPGPGETGVRTAPAAGWCTPTYLRPPDATAAVSMGPIGRESNGSEEGSDRNATIGDDNNDHEKGPEEEDKEQEDDLPATEFSLEPEVDLDPDSNGVSAGFVAGDEHTDGGKSGDSFGKTVSDILGSLFGGLGGSGDKDKKGWREEDPSQTKTDSDGARGKSSVAVMDPPDRPRPPKSVGTDRDDGDDDEKRNPVDYGTDASEGDLSAFLKLGPGASIRLASQKEEGGGRYLLLEGKSQPVDGPSGLQVRVIRQWVEYDLAVRFLKRGFDGSAADDGSLSEGANTMATDDDADDGSSPFFGGNVLLM